MIRVSGRRPRQAQAVEKKGYDEHYATANMEQDIGEIEDCGRGENCQVGAVDQKGQAAYEQKPGCSLFSRCAHWVSLQHRAYVSTVSQT